LLCHQATDYPNQQGNLNVGKLFTERKISKIFYAMWSSAYAICTTCIDRLTIDIFIFKNCLSLMCTHTCMS